MARTAAATYGLLWANAEEPAGFFVFWRLCWHGRGFVIAGKPPGGNVRNYQDSCGLLRRIGGRTVQCGEPPDSFCALLFLLRVP